MKFDRAKLLSAAASLIGVAAAILGGLATLIKAEWLPSTLSALYIGLVGAVVGAAISIVVARDLRANKKPRSVFLIYSRKDLAEVKEVANILREAGFVPWLDVDELVAGQNWRDQIAKAIRESVVAVVLISENMNSSHEAQIELMAAMKQLTAKDRDTFPILPVRLDYAEVPRFLSHVQWIDWNAPDAKEKLLLGLAHATGVSLRGLRGAA